jgi:hypothetical protein
MLMMNDEDFEKQESSSDWSVDGRLIDVNDEWWRFWETRIIKW